MLRMAHLWPIKKKCKKKNKKKSGKIKKKKGIAVGMEMQVVERGCCPTQPFEREQGEIGALISKHITEVCTSVGKKGKELKQGKARR